MLNKQKIGGIILTLLLFPASSVWAMGNNTNPQWKLAKFAGQMSVMEKECGLTDDKSIKQNKKKQKQAMGAMSAQDFDLAYNEGVSEVRTKWSSMSGSERDKSCNDLLELQKSLSSIDMKSKI